MLEKTCYLCGTWIREDQISVTRIPMVLPKFAWLREKTTGLARASCSTKEHIRAVDGSVPVQKASNLHAGPCQAEMAEIEVAQNALCSTAPPGLTKSRQRIDGHRRSSTQIPEEPFRSGRQLPKMI